MFNILDTLIGAIAVAYLLRLGYYYIVRRRRIDWPLERKGFKQELKLMFRIMKWGTRHYWRW